jgi:formylglycine-generating enzyme required for sulfatase activity
MARRAWLFAAFAFGCGDPSRDVVTPGTGPGSDEEILVGMLEVRQMLGWYMGCPDYLEPSPCREAETPYHPVDLSTFFIDRTEVTQGDYDECMDEGRCDAPAEWDGAADDLLPVTNVTWHQARRFCEWRGKRLPTEAEWERAAGGMSSWIYPWGAETPDCARANFAGCYGGLLPAVSLSAGRSPETAFHLAGNAFEWVGDWYLETYYVPPADDVGFGWIDPQGPADDPSLMLKVVRGGAYTSVAEELYTFRRRGRYPGRGEASVGFRCALDDIIE